MVWYSRLDLKKPALCALLFTVMTACGSVREVLPSGDSFVAAADAARDPRTWAPLAGAAVIGVGGWDDNISDWAAGKTPVFGSQDRASKVSDDLLQALVGGMAASSVLAPNQGRYDAFPTERVAANVLAFGSANAVVAGLKETVRRDRPNGSPDQSFPSGHSVAAFTSAYLIEQNLNESVRSPLARASISAASIGLASTVAWARVEGDKHYPVDVLVSAAIGNFFARTFYKSFVGTDGPEAIPVSMEAWRDGFAFRFTKAF
jgi:hypothetical protein